MSNIRDIIKEMIKDQEEIYSLVGVVTEIDEAERTCTVKLSNGGADLFDVRLQSIVNGVIGLVLWPLLNSEVIVSFTAKETSYIALYGEIEKVLLKIGDMELFVDATNANLAVENIDVIATNTEISSDNVKVNASDTQIDSENIDVTAQTVKVVSTSFEVQGTNVKVTAPLVDIISSAVNISGAVTMAGSLSVAGAVSFGGGLNGGIPKGSTLTNIINTMRLDLFNLKNKFTAWVPVGGDGGTALKNQMTTWTPTTAQITQATISNPNAVQ